MKYYVRSLMTIFFRKECLKQQSLCREIFSNFKIIKPDNIYNDSEIFLSDFVHFIVKFELSDLEEVIWEISNVRNSERNLTLLSGHPNCVGSLGFPFTMLRRLCAATRNTGVSEKLSLHRGERCFIRTILKGLE